MPSGDVATALDAQQLAQKTEPFHAMLAQESPVIAWSVQTKPSGDVAVTAPCDIAQNTDPFHATSVHV